MPGRPTQATLLAFLSSIPPTLPDPESPIGGETTFPSRVLLFSSPLPSLPLPLLSLRIRPLKYSQAVWGIAVNSQCDLKLSPTQPTCPPGTHLILCWASGHGHTVAYPRRTHLGSPGYAQSRARGNLASHDFRCCVSVCLCSHCSICVNIGD